MNYNVSATNAQHQFKIYGAVVMNINANNIVAYKPLFTTDGIFSNAPTNTFYVGGDNNFDITAITDPKVRNGIAIGNGDSYTSQYFNNAINSWYGTGFVDTCNKRCYCSIDHRTGNFYTLGFFSAGNSVYTPVIKGINGLEYDTTTSTGVHNFKINGVQKMYLNNTDFTNTINLTQMGAATFNNLITVNGQSTFNGLMNALAGITLGSKNIIGSNISELALCPGDDGSGSTISLPLSGNTNQDYVTVRTNSGVHHAFSTLGNYYCAGNIVANIVTANKFIVEYTTLPNLT
jgi:Phage T4 tail fibre